MKTITLDDEAYGLLKAWKRPGMNSFSAVVKEVVPRPGTLGAFLGFLEANHPAEQAADIAMEKAIEDRAATKEDPWTS